MNKRSEREAEASWSVWTVSLWKKIALLFKYKIGPTTLEGKKWVSRYTDPSTLGSSGRKNNCKRVKYTFLVDQTASCNLSWAVIEHQPQGGIEIPFLQTERKGETLRVKQYSPTLSLLGCRFVYNNRSIADKVNVCESAINNNNKKQAICLISSCLVTLYLDGETLQLIKQSLLR